MNPKLSLIVFAAISFVASGLGQPKTVLVTNWVSPGPNMRVSGGVGYDVETSPAWKKLTDWEHCEFNDDSHTVERIDKDANRVLIWISRNRANWSSRNYAIVFNYPTPSEDMIGLPFDCKCSKLTNVMMNGVSTKAYDYGTAFTNKVAIISRVKVANVATNRAEIK